MTFSETKKEETTIEWSKIAGEAVTIECTSTDAPIYAFGSELACLRLYAKFTKGGFKNGKFVCAFSDNLKSWYFKIEPGF